MNANPSTPLADEYLQSLQGMEQPRSDDFFYVRLKARMEKQALPQRELIYKPALLMGVLLLLLCVNVFMLVRQQKPATKNGGSFIEQVVQAYNLGESSNY
jgi:hypothetical protein